MLCSVNQRYNLKAIHNRRWYRARMQGVVLSKSKIQSKSNSQLRRCSGLSEERLCSVNQRYNLKAIHNGLGSGQYPSWLCSVNQRYNLKAIHNSSPCLSFVHSGCAQ